MRIELSLQWGEDLYLRRTVFLQGLRRMSIRSISILDMADVLRNKPTIGVDRR